MEKEIVRHDDSTDNPHSSENTFRTATGAAWNEEAFDDFDLRWRVVNVLKFKMKCR